MSFPDSRQKKKCWNMAKHNCFKMDIRSKIQALENCMSQFLGALQTFFEEFTHKSNIHGFRYFSERRLHWSERLWWLVSLALSLWLCGSMIRDVWIQWNQPTFDFSEKTHISTIPFPTVIICPEIKNLRRKIDISSKFDQNFKVLNLSEKEVAQLSAMAHVCPVLGSKIFKDEFTNESIYNIIEEMAPNLEYTIRECWWQQKRINCSEYMSPIFTHKGLCFTFNGLNYNDMYTNGATPHKMAAAVNNRKLSLWSLESGYEKQFGDNEYPMRVFDSGRKGSLELVLSSNTQDHGDFNCIGSRQGFIVFLSSPGDSVETKTVSQIEFSENTIITVKPKVITASKALRNYKPMQRECFFNSERQLRFYKSYTEDNCVLECLANLTKRVCGCVGFFMPRNSKDTKICGAAKIKCYGSQEKSLAQQQCNCLPSCTSIEYETKVDAAKLIPTTGKRREPQPNGLSRQHTRLSIFYDTEIIEVKKRVESYSLGDFLAVCGGLAGLFFGISLLSVIELIYYATLRLFWIIYRPRNREQSDREETDAISFDENSFTNQNRTKLFRAILKARIFLIEYCDNSNMHGFRYFSERKLHWSERLFWLITFAVSLWLCGSMTRNVWIQWAEDPVKMSTTEKTVSAKTIPFPTLTICPEIKTTKDMLDVTAALNSSSKLSDIEMKRLNALAHVCPRLSHLMTFKDNFADESIYDTIQDIAPNILQSIAGCRWLYGRKPCSELWAPVFTEDGLCFTFNALNSHEIYTDEMAPEMMTVKNNPNSSGWSVESGYANQSAEGNYPFQMRHARRKSWTSLGLLINQTDIEYQCRGSDKGFKIILSMPGEAVETSQNYLRLPSLYQNILGIRVKMSVTSDGLRGYTPNQRQCFYSSDHPLRFFKIYTKKNCEAECKANFTAIECGCVKFSMPRDKYTKICGGANLKCYKTAHINLFTSKIGEKFRDKCNCLPSCMSFEYAAKIHRTAFNKTQLNKMGLPKNLQLSYFFLDSVLQHSNVLTRKEVYTFTDFLAACGGLLGLFLGASAISIIEIIYYSTLRLYWTIKMKRIH